MPARSRTLWLARRGHSSTEYEDAFAADDAAGRFAVADGATEGCFTGLWARLLVEDFVSNGNEGIAEWPSTLAVLQERWDASVRTPDLPWYAEQGVIQGAFAAFLGLAVAAPSKSSYEWQAVAVGDTCVLHTRKNELLRAFPIERAEHFDNLPKLVGSRTPVEATQAKLSMWTDGRGQPGDRLWIMTDALAQWSLKESEAGRNPWGDLESFLAKPEGGDQFVSWIEGLRDTAGLRNDDVTLLAIQL